MSTISVCMIVKNEEKTLTRCLKGASKVADELIVVDTGSDDSTKSIAYSFTDNVFDFEWCDDFALARNYSFSKAKCDYIMWLDADDVLTDKAVSDINSLKALLSEEKPDVVMMKYNTGFDSDGNVTFSYYRERILKRHADFIWQGAVHEAITPEGKIIYSDIGINHNSIKKTYTDRNLTIYEKLISSGKKLSPREQYYYARELWFNSRFTEAISVFDEFIQRDDAWKENKIDACNDCSKCYLQLNDTERALKQLFSSFVYDNPRAEICCSIGDIFLNGENYSQAAYWYETALKCTKNEKSGAFIRPECYDFIPYIQLCVCYDRLGEHSIAEKYNEMAGKIKTNSKAVLHNNEYFRNLFKQ